MLFSRILVPIDDSPPAHAAVDLAIGIASRFGSELVVCTAIDTRVLVDLDEMVKDEARALLDAVCKKAELLEQRVQSEVLVGTPAFAIAEFAREKRVDLIVMGTHARSGLPRIVLGSTTAGVLAATEVPTLVTRSHDPARSATTKFAHVLVAVDDSEPADAAIALAIELGAHDRSSLVFCNVIEGDQLISRAVEAGYDPQAALADLRARANAMIATALATARGRGVEAEGAIVEGFSADKLLETAHAHDANLVVIGTHGRRGLRRLFVGSVAGALARTSDVPVLVVRSGAC